MGKLTDNQFLFSFEGRINRAKYWYALFASMISGLVFMAAVASAIGVIFGAAVKSVHLHILDVFNNPPSFPFGASFSNADPETTALVSLIFHIAGTPIFIVSLWFLTASTIKRLHDRNRSGWWIFPFFIAPALLGSIVDRLDDESDVAVALALVAFGLNAWGFVELLFFKGRSGPNRFGADPLAPAVPDAPAATDTPATVHWDQLSELEFVPYSASPSPRPHVKRGT
jgi:uncharacterized membrane protein YhaH (DUF805 family)